MLDQLKRAQEALVAGDEDAALKALLAAWRETPAPSLAELIDDVSARAAKKRPAIAGKTQKAQHAAWLEIAAKKDPADLPRLHALIPTLRSQPAHEEMEVLLDGESDPRHTTFFAGMIREPPYIGGGTLRVWRRIFGLLEKFLDPQLAGVLGGLDYLAILPRGRDGGDGTREVMISRTKTILGKLAKKHPTLPALDGEAAALVDKMLGAAKKNRASTEDLLAAVLANPNDDGARQVYGDALVEAGDARGELIALQFRAERDHKRERALIDEHWRSWLGDLAKIVEAGTVVFEKGFPAEVAVNLDTPDRRNLALGHPLWATVRVIEMNRLNDFPKDVLLHPAMRALDGIIDLSREQLRALADRKEPIAWRRLGYRGPSFYADSVNDQHENAVDVAIISSLTTVLPRLEWLGLSGYLVGPKVYEWLWETDTGRALTRFDVSSGIKQLAAWIHDVEARAMPKLAWLRVCHHFQRCGWQLDARRGPDGRFSSLRAVNLGKGQGYQTPELLELADVMDELPADQLVELRVESVRVTKAAVQKIEAAAKRQSRLTTLSLP